MPRALLKRPGTGLTMSGGPWSADELLRPVADLPVPAMSSWARAFPGIPHQVKVARHFVASLLAGSPLCDDAVLVISELFTNALQHTGSGRPGGLVVVQVSRWRQGVRIAVTDQGSARPPVIRGTHADPGFPRVSATRAVTDTAMTDRLLAGGMFADDLLDEAADIMPDDGGRGLYMVSCLAAHLDWHDDLGGRTVHAVLGRLPAAAPWLAAAAPEPAELPA
jgi:Histidine kinase-like ATPase domain